MCRFSSFEMRANSCSATGSRHSFTGVAVGNAGGEFLERHVHDGVEETLGEEVALFALAGGEAAGHLLHAELLEFDRIAVAGDHEVVAQRDAVPVLSAVQRLTQNPQGPSMLKFIAISR